MHTPAPCGLLLAAWLLLPSSPAAAATDGEIRLEVRTRAEWVELPGASDHAGAALRFVRALDPRTGEPAGAPPQTEAARHMRRAFRLEAGAHLLGEPIPVEHRVEWQGEGGWDEPFGGNYRGRGRDDNFLFLLQAEDGSWVEDTYGPEQPMMGGGLGSTHRVEAQKPLSQWHGLQRWVALARPGRYRLHALLFARGWETLGLREALEAGLPAELARTHRLGADNALLSRDTGQPSGRRAIPSLGLPEGTPSPLLARLPVELVAHLGRERLTELTDFAVLELDIRPGTAEERQRMRADWSRALRASEAHGSWPPGRLQAVREALVFSRQDDFLPLLEAWGGKDDWEVMAGLAMRGSPAAFALLARRPHLEAASAMAYLPPARIPDAIPVLIAWLTDADNQVRAQAEMHLARFTGHELQHTWRGYDWQRPTPEEARALQPLWQAWWAEHRAGFQPPGRPGAPP